MALVLAGFLLTGIAGLVHALLNPELRRVLAGGLLVALAIAATASYGYAVLWLPGTDRTPPDGCSGAPYEVC